MLNFFNSKTLISVITVLLAAVIFLWSITSGWNAGKNLSQTQAVTHNLQALTQAVQYFYNDQDRYPTAVEFSDQNALGKYLNTFPVSDIISKNCPQSFIYKRPSPQAFQLNFCLPLANGSFTAGWNQFIPNK